MDRVLAVIGGIAVGKTTFIWSLDTNATIFSNDGNGRLGKSDRIIIETTTWKKALEADLILVLYVSLEEALSRNVDRRRERKPYISSRAVVESFYRIYSNTDLSVSLEPSLDNQKRRAEEFLNG